MQPENDPKELDSFLGMGIYYSEFEKYEDSLEWHDKAIQLDPTFEPSFKFRAQAAAMQT